MYNNNKAKPITKAMPPPPPPTKTTATKYVMKTSNTYPEKAASRYPTPAPSPPKPKFPLPPRQSRHSVPVKQTAPETANSSTKQATKMQWQEHTDSTLAASDRPVFWSRNSTVLKSNTDLTNGCVTSPTWMHGLPFGAMVEVAHHYPSEERLDRE